MSASFRLARVTPVWCPPEVRVILPAGSMRTISVCSTGSRQQAAGKWAGTSIREPELEEGGEAAGRGRDREEGDPQHSRGAAQTRTMRYCPLGD